MQKQHITSRYHLIDAIRGFALINMLAYHFCYDIFMMNSVDRGWCSYPWVVVWERFICISFIIISGIAVNFSKNVYKRGLIINLFGFIITAVTVIVIPQEAVWFGILNLLGCSMIITQLFRKLLDKISPFIGFFISLILFSFSYGIPYRYLGIFGIRLIRLPDILYSTNIFALIGFPSASFRSTDYFPLIPWVFMFVLGYFLWKCIVKFGLFYVFKKNIFFLSAVGRYSIWIYMIHQPVLAGIAWVLVNL